ncbi:PEPxxWA-CTERM sorting domain-containing protein [Phenylobacterium sp.]|uniref:PEPxxWA-CTERM sorting domain-containing protein n=1 Tax=Phenylobacterium sp. TaxID=1871053 RepID=UPI00261E6608|nr:PEPxxWA-CTERM sorting domain-containing protein [Phenylobacterium sp.]
MIDEQDEEPLILFGPDDAASLGTSETEDLFASGDSYGPYVGAVFAPIQAAPFVAGLPFDGDPCVGLPSTSGATCDGYFQGPTIGGQSDLLNFKPSHLTISVDGTLPDELLSIPEPSTWTMMLAGFFGVGTALRRRFGLGAGGGRRARHGKNRSTRNLIPA